MSIELSGDCTIRVDFRDLADKLVEQPVEIAEMLDQLAKEVGNLGREDMETLVSEVHEHLGDEAKRFLHLLWLMEGKP